MRVDAGSWSTGRLGLQRFSEFGSCECRNDCFAQAVNFQVRDAELPCGSHLSDCTGLSGLQGNGEIRGRHDIGAAACLGKFANVDASGRLIDCITASGGAGVKRQVGRRPAYGTSPPCSGQHLRRRQPPETSVEPLLCSPPRPELVFVHRRSHVDPREGVRSGWPGRIDAFPESFRVQSPDGCRTP